jgi:hypothetical protein
MPKWLVVLSPFMTSKMLTWLRTTTQCFDYGISTAIELGISTWHGLLQHGVHMASALVEMKTGKQRKT